MQSLKQAARRLKKETYAVYLASTDQRVPWYTRILAGLTVAYAFSPIDLIPDFIPVVGYLDDAILLPLGVLLARRLVPPLVLERCRVEAASRRLERPRSRWGAVAVVATWLALLVLAVWLVRTWT